MKPLILMDFKSKRLFASCVLWYSYIAALTKRIVPFVPSVTSITGIACQGNMPKLREQVESLTVRTETAAV